MGCPGCMGWPGFRGCPGFRGWRVSGVAPASGAGRADLAAEAHAARPAAPARPWTQGRLQSSGKTSGRHHPRAWRRSRLPVRLRAAKGLRACRAHPAPCFGRKRAWVPATWRKRAGRRAGRMVFSRKTYGSLGYELSQAGSNPPVTGLVHYLQYRFIIFPVGRFLSRTNCGYPARACRQLDFVVSLRRDFNWQGGRGKWIAGVA